MRRPFLRCPHSSRRHLTIPPSPLSKRSCIPTLITSTARPWPRFLCCHWDRCRGRQGPSSSGRTWRSVTPPSYRRCSSAQQRGRLGRQEEMGSRPRREVSLLQADGAACGPCLRMTMASWRLACGVRVEARRFVEHGLWKDSNLLFTRDNVYRCLVLQVIIAILDFANQLFLLFIVCEVDVNRG